ncbi:flavin reductase family protein [Roseomonas sp. OT10]|uniref:flavin reductase family protein n=1 Tax=Roseomonas cutis TaxID=2897332 RepID=UPI001E5FD76F|nr:flavin reductase family protein [Roseomonas sp. OT10]UFN50441.1 flavin reductase family protein [Roseomonas sp. OT10]
MTTHFYETARGHGLRHDPFKAILVPRPIGWISTVDAGGRVNLAPYSFFGGFSSRPPIVGFSSEGLKDSARNAAATGEFVCNLATRDLAEAMNLTSAALPPGTDEMEFAGLESAPSTLVRPPRVAATPAAMECRVLQVIALKDLEGQETGAHLVLGQVVGVHIDPAYLRDGIFDTAAARPIARCGYRGDYATVESLFEMVRPVV